MINRRDMMISSVVGLAGSFGKNPEKKFSEFQKYEKSLGFEILQALEGFEIKPNRFCLLYIYENKKFVIPDELIVSFVASKSIMLYFCYINKLSLIKEKKEGYYYINSCLESDNRHLDRHSCQLLFDQIPFINKITTRHFKDGKITSVGRNYRKNYE